MAFVYIFYHLFFFKESWNYCLLRTVEKVAGNPLLPTSAAE